MAGTRRFTLLLSIAALALASCGADDASSPTPTTAAPTGTVATTSAAPPTTEATAETTTTTAAVETETSGAGQVEVVFEDGRSMTFEGICDHTPDNSGPAAALWRIDATAADGATFIAILAFPFDPAKTDPVLIGNIVDADENVFVLIESEDVSDGSNLILNLGLHDSVFRTVDDPIDLTATATCRL